MEGNRAKEMSAYRTVNYRSFVGTDGRTDGQVGVIGLIITCTRPTPLAKDTKQSPSTAPRSQRHRHDAFLHFVVTPISSSRFFCFTSSIRVLKMALILSDPLFKTRKEKLDVLKIN